MTLDDDVATRIWTRGLDRLNPNWPLLDTPPQRWVTFLYDGRRFLDRGGAERAISFGWTVYDLFGCDRNAPYARVDKLGLLWLLNGRRLIKFDVDQATIGCGKGTKLVYRRAPFCLVRVLPWDIT